MSNNQPRYDRWGNLISPEPPGQTVRPPHTAWLGQGSTSLPPVHPPPPYGPSRSDYPTPPSFPVELPPPSPPSMPTTGGFGFSTSIRFGPPGSGTPSLPPGLPSLSPTGGVPPYRHVPTPASSSAPPRPPIGPIPPTDTEKRYASPAFERPLCSTCNGNCVNVREGPTNFCNECFQEALRCRGMKDSSKANWPKCKICTGSQINVKEGENIYCQECWSKVLRKRSMREEERVKEEEGR